ncbi:MAG: D-3-phosphoglycerate dehydrogenase (EC [uncultured Caballeronia sp.]|nr:MAG: D-3-phosphoglycerate dehydrogenase (EC [uncultured Caballeronia sp.]
MPQTHPFWRHPQILVTPHIASRTSPATIARQTLDNYRHVCAGRMPPSQSDPRHGYRTPSLDCPGETCEFRTI